MRSALILAIDCDEGGEAPSSERRGVGASQLASRLADLPIAALRLLDKLALGPREEAFADLKQRVQAWTAAWESDDPELDPEEDVGCNDVEGGV